MTTARTKAPPASSATDAAEIPWYELINDAPEPPEDAMQQEDTILEVMSILKARYENVPGALWLSQSNVIYDSDVPGLGRRSRRRCRARTEDRCKNHQAQSSQLPHRRMGSATRIRAWKWRPRARRIETWARSARYTRGWARKSTGGWTGMANTTASR